MDMLVKVNTLCGTGCQNGCFQLPNDGNIYILYEVPTYTYISVQKGFSRWNSLNDDCVKSNSFKILLYQAG